MEAPAKGKHIKMLIWQVQFISYQPQKSIKWHKSDSEFTFRSRFLVASAVTSITYQRKRQITAWPAEFPVKLDHR